MLRIRSYLTRSQLSWGVSWLQADMMEGIARADGMRVRSSSLLALMAAWGALLSALGASLYLAVVPTYESATVDVSTGASASQPPVLSRSATLASVNGPIVFA